MEEFLSYTLSSQANGSQCSFSPGIKSVFLFSIQVINIKLNRFNFRFWKYQVLSVITTHDLESHLLGFSTCPIPFIQVKTPILAKETSFTKQTNPDCILW